MKIEVTTIATALGLLIASAQPAAAQPADPPPASPDSESPDGQDDASPDGPDDVLEPWRAPDPGETGAGEADSGTEPGAEGAAAPTEPDSGTFDPTAVSVPPPPPPPPSPPRGPVLPAGHPRLFVSPTGTLVPAAVIYTTTGLDTSGGFASDLRIGLGGVGEFGIEHFDQVRWTEDGIDENRVAPLFLATFKLGLPEDRFFLGQPSLAIGLRKSFQAEESIYALRMAELFVVATRTLGDSVRLHVGGLLGDAEIENTQTGDKAFLHQRPLARQARVFGGFELETLPDARIIVEWNYVPLYRLQQVPQASDMSLRAQLLWGIRYAVTRSTSVEAGVRVGDIANANLIDAHIFGRLTFATDALTRAFD